MRTMFSVMSNLLNQVPKTVNSAMAQANVQPFNTSVLGFKLFTPLLYTGVLSAIHDLIKLIPQGQGSMLDDGPFWSRLAKTFNFTTYANWNMPFYVDAALFWHALDGDYYQYNDWLSILKWFVTTLKSTYQSMLVQIIQQFENALIQFLQTWGENVFDYIVQELVTSWMYNTSGLNPVPYILLLYAFITPTYATTPIKIPVAIVLGSMPDVFNVPSSACSSMPANTQITSPLIHAYFWIFATQPNMSSTFYQNGLLDYTGAEIGYNYNGTTYYYWHKVVYFGYKNSYMSQWGQTFENWLLDNWYYYGRPWEIAYNPYSANEGLYTNSLAHAYLQVLASYGIAGTNGPNNTYVVYTSVGTIQWAPQSLQGDTFTNPTSAWSINFSTCSNISGASVEFYTIFVYASTIEGTSASAGSYVNNTAGYALLQMFASTLYDQWIHGLESGSTTLSDITKNFPSSIIPTIRPIIYDFPETINNLMVAFGSIQKYASSLNFNGLTTTTISGNNGFPSIIITSPEIEVSGNFKKMNATIGAQNYYGVVIDPGTSLFNNLGKVVYSVAEGYQEVEATPELVTVSLSTPAVFRPDFYVAETGDFAPISPEFISTPFQAAGWYINTNYALYIPEGSYIFDVIGVDEFNDQVYSGSAVVSVSQPILYVPNGYGVYTSTGLVYQVYVPQFVTPPSSVKPNTTVMLAGILLLTLIGYFGTVKK